MNVRVTRMNWVDLNLFQFDYDVTLAIFFMNADGRIYARYGGRDHTSSTSHHTAASLRKAMREALALHTAAAVERAAQAAVGKAAPVPPLPPRRTPEDFPPLNRDLARQPFCVKCHMVWDYGRAAEREAKTWRRESTWVYPPPDNLGLTMDVDEGNLVKSVRPGSPADKAGFRAGDVVRKAADIDVVTWTDLQFALHNAPAEGRLALTAERDGRKRDAELNLPAGWRKTDLSWRKSSMSLVPRCGAWVREIDPPVQAKLGVAAGALALEVFFVEADTPAAEAGLAAKDVVVAVDGKVAPMTANEFRAYWPTSHDPGDTAVLTVLRAGKRIEIKLKL